MYISGLHRSWISVLYAIMQLCIIHYCVSIFFYYGLNVYFNVPLSKINGYYHYIIIIIFICVLVQCDSLVCP